MLKKELRKYKHASCFHLGTPHMEIKSKEITTTWKETICMKMFTMVLAIAAATPTPKKFCNKTKIRED